MSSTRRVVLLLTFVLSLLVAPAAAQDADMSAQDLLYEAADAIDGAVREQQAGRDLEADRLLNRAEDFLNRAERIEPGLGRIAYERARLLRVDGDPDTAEKVLLGAMASPNLAIGDHTEAVSLLDSIRYDLGQPPVSVQWRRATSARNVGLGMLLGGAVASVIGYSVAFSTLADATYERSAVDAPRQQAGMALAAVGGGLAVGGGGLTIGGQVQVAQLESILPGPWRLRGGQRRAR